jgi:hypothetical protein
MKIDVDAHRKSAFAIRRESGNQLRWNLFDNAIRPALLRGGANVVCRVGGARKWRG